MILRRREKFSGGSVAVGSKNKVLNDTKHRCKECNEAFNKINDLDTHFLNRHIKMSNPDTCKYWSKQFSYQSLEKLHRKYSFNCKYCVSSFENLCDLKDHIKIWHGEKRMWKCDFCGKELMSFNYLKNHLIDHPEFECSKCGEKFLKKNVLRNHILTECFKEIENRKQCLVCRKEFFTQWNLNWHMIKLHSANRKVIGCEQSENDFNKKNSLNINVQNFKESHPADALYNCIVCGKVFSNVTQLKRHLKIHSDEFSCEYCFEKFPRSCILESHILQKHVAEKSYTCDVCEKCFHDGNLLKEHKKMFHMIDFYKCDLCYKPFDKFMLLEKHIKKVHPSIKQVGLQCFFCPKKFESPLLLKLHENFHFSSFECISCGNVFKTSKCLWTHVQKEHKEAMKNENESILPQCICCSRTFVNPSGLMKHVKEEHDSCVCTCQEKIRENGVVIKKKCDETEPAPIRYKPNGKLTGNF